MQSKMLIAAVLIVAFQTACESATPQRMDRLTFGGRVWKIREIPMLGLWDYRGEATAEPGKVKPPRFEVGSSANWSGYEAEFEIRESKLFLKKISGRVAGEKRKNEALIPGKRFPIVATWFTGKIHLEVGHFDFDEQESTAVIIFHVEEGVVTKTDFAVRMKPVWTWNGLPPVPSPRNTKQETSENAKR